MTIFFFLFFLNLELFVDFCLTKILPQFSLLQLRCFQWYIFADFLKFSPQPELFLTPLNAFSEHFFPIFSGIYLLTLHSPPPLKFDYFFFFFFIVFFPPPPPPVPLLFFSFPSFCCLLVCKFLLLKILLFFTLSAQDVFSGTYLRSF